MTTGVISVGARIKFMVHIYIYVYMYAYAFPDIREIGAWAFLKFIEFLELGSGPGPSWLRDAETAHGTVRHGTANLSTNPHPP